ncbi:hypothetical protein RWD45_13560 [Virgibacillus soli]|uniref:Lipoprotein YvcA n=2 Tax=Paracerasibacillus soli TaxID=480284 RepID=A0ABU5CSR2_9BACI|nr:hypothetical protein [Virgibacillus soli]MDY0409413.1 hypothetical protein [Virgibacillus soli]
MPLQRIITLSMIFTLLVSCSMFEKPITERDPKDLPDVMAFQDEFTRGFMTSTEEVEDGYYLFESKTGGYTMWYPEDARMDDMYYQRNKEYSEHIKFGGSHDKITHNTYYVHVTYNKSKNVKKHELYLDLLSSMSGYEGQYEKSISDDITIYFAQRKNVDVKTSFHTFFGFVAKDDSNQGLRYEYTIICEEDGNNGCTDNLEEVEAHVRKLMKSIVFK